MGDYSLFCSGNREVVAAVGGEDHGVGGVVINVADHEVY